MAKRSAMFGVMAAVLALIPATAGGATPPGPIAGRRGDVTRPLTAGPGPTGLLVVGSAAPPTGNGNAVGGVVTVINTANNAVTRVVKIDAIPTAVAVAPDGKTVYVAGAGSDVFGSPGTFRSINATTGVVSKVTKVGTAPAGIALSPDGRTAYLLCGFDAATQKPAGSVWPINAVTGAAGVQIKVVAAPSAIDIAAGGTAAYVIGEDAISLFRTSAGGTGKVVDVALQATGVAMTKNGQTAYVAGHAPRSFIQVVPVNTTTGDEGKGISTGASVPADLAISPNGKTVFVVGTPDPGLGATDDTVTEISTSTDKVGKTINLGPHPGINEWAIAIDPNGKEAYVLGYGSTKAPGLVIPINIGTGVAGKPIAAGDNAGAITFAANGNWAYVLDAGSEGSSTSHGQVVPINTAANMAGKPIPISAYADVMAAS